MAGRTKVSATAALLAGAALVDVGLGCTIIAVGKDASAYGAPMVGHSEDSGPVANDIRLIRVPRRKWKKGSKRPLYNVNAFYPRIVDAERSPEYAPVDGQKMSEPLGYIDQVEETYGYWDTDYGVQNEMGVSIGESTCTAMTVGWPSDVPYGYNKAGIEELSKIAMERCDTARCAAQTMGDIAVELGFYSADSATPEAPGYVGSSECLTIADAKKGELWNFNVMTGKNNASAIWAAQRVPSNHVMAVGNAFTIRKMNLSDHENFIYSPNVSSLAEEKGWWSPKLEKSKDIFDFFYAYGWTPGKDAIPVNVESVISAYSGRRMWRVFNLLSPEEGAKLDPERGNLPHTVDPYPSSIPAPKHSVTLKMVQDAYRDHYEGTAYDLTKGMAAGPHGNPNRGNPDLSVVGQWERAIAMYRTSWSFVNIAKPNGRSILWFGYDCAHGTVYLPFYGAATKGAPESYHSHAGTMAKFSFDVAWWPYSFVNQWSENNFELINPVVLGKARELEAKSLKLVEDWEREASYFENESPEGAMDMLTERSNRLAEETFKDWWAFAWSLVSKYRGMMIVHNDSATGTEWQRYPGWWLESLDVGYTTWTKTGPYHGVADSPKKAMELSALPASGLATSTVDALPILVAAVAVLGAYVMGRSHGRDAVARSDQDCYISVA